MSATKTGAYGESLALARLLQKGYKLLGRNLRFGHCELDLVMQDGSTIVFVEVKARSGTAYGTPAEAVTKQKQRRLIQAAQSFLLQNQCADAFARFDVVEIYLQNGEIHHIENAFST